jgi:hypothetical protein
MRSTQSGAAESAPVPENSPDQRRSGQRSRYVPTAAYTLAEYVKRMGVKLAQLKGPWRSAEHPIPAHDRNAPQAIPIVTNGQTEMMVDTMEHAIDLAGFLNWCGVHHLRPVRDLMLPPELRTAPTRQT